jgi:hypothetical protein
MPFAINQSMTLKSSISSFLSVESMLIDPLAGCSIAPSFYSGADGLVVVYDITRLVLDCPKTDFGNPVRHLVYAVSNFTQAAPAREFPANSFVLKQS